MPELPEVETLKRGLEEILRPESEVKALRFLSPSLRGPLPVEKCSEVKAQKIVGIFRRAKYLFIELEEHYLLSHLGMTGSWRVKSSPRDHDHIEIDLSDGRTLVYRDPRRFGQFDILPKGLLNQDRRLKSLGPEPLGEDFTGDYLFQIAKKKKTPIKSMIMDQRVVVGVGNIYASESLYLAQLNPFMKANRLNREQAERWVYWIRDVLEDAIAFGGTTLNDFRQAGGAEGYFQNRLFVYGEEGEPCAICDNPISSRVLTGRSTFWCSKCQR